MTGTFTKIGMTLLAAYAFIVLAAWLGQRRLMYLPSGPRVAPAAAGLPDVKEIEIATPDGARVVGWRLVAREGQPTLLYFHGNAGGLVNRALRARRYRDLGYGFLIMSYRGFSGSTGSPSEAANIADARLAYEKLIADGVKPADIVLYGESLGSGIAVQLAAEKPVGAVVLDAPYTSMIDMAAKAYPFLPVRPLLADRYESRRYITRVSAPVLILHGKRDRIIPVSMGEALHALAREPKRLVVFPEGGHVDLDDFGAVEAVRAFVAEMRKAPQRQ